MKKNYQIPELQVLMIFAEDVIATSDGFEGEADWLIDPP